MTADLEFDSDVRRRIYECVERNGAADREEVRDAVRVEPDRGGSKPTRSAVAETVRLSREQLHEHVRALVETGHLKEVDGELRLAVDASPERFELDDGTPVTVRLAQEEDSEGVRAAMREIVDERTSIVAESVAEALDDEPVLRRTRRRSRVFFVATVGEADGAASGEGGGASEREVEDETGSGPAGATGTDGTGAGEAGPGGTGTDGEVVGWVHLDAPEVEKLRHTAELTVGVRSDYRGQSIGSRLLDRGLDWADEQSYGKVYQSVPATNDAAVEFLEDHGWTVEAIRADHYLVDDELVDEVMLATWLEG